LPGTIISWDTTSLYSRGIIRYLGTTQNKSVLQELELSIASNPAREVLQLARKESSGELTLEIRDLLGKSIHRTTWPDREPMLRLQISKFPRGSYLVTVFRDKVPVALRKVVFIR
jgi:hypothetical protein